MKIFISWSGETSQKLGEAIKEWIPSVLQAVKPYFTPTDIEKGTRWAQDISKELESSDFGIFCFTRKNLSSSWMLFEAGALSKKLDKSRVCPILFDIDNTDIAGPIRQFQTTNFTKQDFLKLVRSVNKAIGEIKLDDGVLVNVYEKWWPDLESKVQEILKEESTNKNKPLRTERELLEEILELSRLNSRRTRLPFNQNALYDLIEKYLKVHQLIKNREDYTICMDELKNLYKPIRYISRNFPETKNEMLEELQNLKFEVEENPEDEALPF